MEEAAKNGYDSIALPFVIDNGNYLDKKTLIKAALETIYLFLEKKDMKVFLVVSPRENKADWAKHDEIDSYLERTLEQQKMPLVQKREKEVQSEYCDYCETYTTAVQSFSALEDSVSNKRKPTASKPALQIDSSKESIERLIVGRDESFQQMLMRKIAEKGMTDAQCYKKANAVAGYTTGERSDWNADC